jgi:hypothetical protein
MDYGAPGGEGHFELQRIMAGRGVTVDSGTTGPARRRAGPVGRRDRKERIMPHLNLGALRATCRAALRRLDTWTLESLNSPAGGRRPRL